MSYDEKKQYIQDQVLQGSSVMEKLIKLNENKLQVDTQNFKDRLDSSRKIKLDKFLTASKKDPLFEELQLKDKDIACGLSPGSYKKARKIPGITDIPRVLPEVPVQLKQQIDDEYDASIRQYTQVQEAKESGIKPKVDPNIKIKPTQNQLTDQIKERLGFVNKKLKLQNYIAKMIIEIKEEMARDEEKRLI